jgi:hypothetical protein
MARILIVENEPILLEYADSVPQGSGHDTSARACSFNGKLRLGVHRHSFAGSQIRGVVVGEPAKDGPERQSFTRVALSPPLISTHWREVPAKALHGSELVRC